MVLTQVKSALPEGNLSVSTVKQVQRRRKMVHVFSVARVNVQYLSMSPAFCWPGLVWSQTTGHNPQKPTARGIRGQGSKENSGIIPLSTVENLSLLSIRMEDITVEWYKIPLQRSTTWCHLVMGHTVITCHQLTL